MRNGFGEHQEKIKIKDRARCDMAAMSQDSSEEPTWHNKRTLAPATSADFLGITQLTSSE
jgi:hypothetical protein